MDRDHGGGGVLPDRLPLQPRAVQSADPPYPGIVVSDRWMATAISTRTSATCAGHSSSAIFAPTPKAWASRRPRRTRLPAHQPERRRGSRTQRSIHHSRSFAGCEKPRGSSPGAARWSGPQVFRSASVIRLKSVVRALCRRPTAAEENKPGLRCSNVHPPHALEQSSRPSASREAADVSARACGGYVAP